MPGRGHRTTDELAAWMPHVPAAPRGEGRVEMVVRPGDAVSVVGAVAADPVEVGQAQPPA